MLRFPLLMAIFLVCAEIVQFAVLPPLRDALPGNFSALFNWRLLALAGILAGLLRGELGGMLTALVAAALFGFSGDPNDLGLAIVSYGMSAYLGGWLARMFRLNRFHTRAFTVFFLLFVEALLWGLARKIFWPETSIEIPWLSIIITAIFGAIFYAMLASRFKRDLFDES